MLKHPLDTSKTKKYSKWLYRYGSSIDSDILKSIFYSYLLHVDSNRVNPDIYHYKSFNELTCAVEYAEKDKRFSLKGQQTLYDVLIDNTDIVLFHLRSHDSARKIGLKYFSFRNKDGKKDCAWCTSFSSKSHFNYYYYNHDSNIYYLLIRMDAKYKAIAFVVYPNGDIKATDELDNTLPDNSVISIINQFNLQDAIVYRLEDKKYELYLKLNHLLNKNSYFIKEHLSKIYILNDTLYYTNEIYKILKRTFSLSGFEIKCYLYGYGIDVLKTKIKFIKIT